MRGGELRQFREIQRNSRNRSGSYSFSRKYRKSSDSSRNSFRPPCREPGIWVEVRESQEAGATGPHRVENPPLIKAPAESLHDLAEPLCPPPVHQIFAFAPLRGDSSSGRDPALDSLVITPGGQIRSYRIVWPANRVENTPSVMRAPPSHAPRYPPRHRRRSLDRASNSNLSDQTCL